MVVKGGGDRQVGWGLRGLLIQVKDSREGGAERIHQSEYNTYFPEFIRPLKVNYERVTSHVSDIKQQFLHGSKT